MKTKYLFIAAIGVVTLASCADDVFVGDNSPNVIEETTVYDGSIRFGSGFKAVTRANEHVGADAATLLSNHFTVGGFKRVTSPASTSTVFDNYIVKWYENTAGKTESNTSDWEYVGENVAQPSSLYITSTTDPNYPAKQTIKYWDYSTDQYDFVAYSTGSSNQIVGAASSGNIQVTAIDPANLTTAAYTLTGATRADLIDCYIANMVTAYKADNPATYGKEVTLTFRRLASKVRIALYETVPGYSVKDVKFYTHEVDPTNLGIDPTTSAATTGNAALIGTMYNAGTYTVYFKTIGSTNKTNPDYNMAHVSFAPTTSTNTTFQEFGTLVSPQLVGKEYLEKTGTLFLGRSSTEATFAGSAAPFYVDVLPNETGEVFELAIDYTLESIDGSSEDIHVYGATAYIPADFTKWQPNFAYTYIFKISDNSNGWTSKVETDPKGLFPITFDAIVVDTEENTQSTITTVATPSITTYQKGHTYTDGPEYKASTENDIYVQVMVDGTLKGDLNSKGQLYTLSANKTEAEVLDALNIQSTSDANTITGRNELVLTKATSSATITSIPGEDGNPIGITAGEAASFAATVGTYAYVYTTDEYAGTYYPTEPAGWPTGYFTDQKCQTAATGTFAAGTFYQTTPSYIYTAVKFAKDAPMPSDWATDVYYEDPDGATGYTSWNSSTFPDGGKTLYRKYTVNHKVYGVKVIKVVN